MDWEPKVKIGSTLEDSQVGESRSTSPIVNNYSPPSSNASNKKIPNFYNKTKKNYLHTPEISVGFDVIDSATGKHYDGRCVGFVSERYFRNGESFSKVRGMIDAIRAKLKPKFL